MYLYGASGHGKVIIEILEMNGISVSGIFDDGAATIEMSGYTIYSGEKAFGLEKNDQLIVSIGNNAIRKKIAELLKVSFGKALHPSANLSTRCQVGEGTVVMAGVSVNSGSVIGRHCILNTNCSVDHDCRLEDYIHISPNVALAGNVTVGAGTHIGIGASIIPGINIGKWVTIGAGAVIIKDIPDHAVAVGNPGKIIKYNTP